MAFAALAALITTGGVGMTVGAVIAGIGTGLSIVGLVTENKALMKIGGVMTLVGGVASFAASAATSAAGEVAGEAAMDGAFNAAKDSQLANVAIEAGGGDALSGYAADAATNWSTAADEALNELGSWSTDSPITESVTPDGPSLDATPDVMPKVDPVKSLINEAPASNQAATQNTLTSPDGSRINNPSAFDSSTTAFKAPASTEYFKDFLNWVKNKENRPIMELVSGGMSGMQKQSMFDEEMDFRKSRGQYGNVVASVYEKPAKGLIGARA